MARRGSLALAAALAVLASASAASIPAVIPVLLNTTRPYTSVAPHFISFCFDLQILPQALSWGFFSSPSVRSAIAGLAPAFFRVSGTQVDSFLYNDTDTSCANSNKKKKEEALPPSLSDGPACMNRTQLTTILSFSNATGLDLVLGLNGRLGKNETAPDAPWDSSNARTLFSALAEILQEQPTLRPPYGWELGNEPDLWHNFFKTPVNGSALAADLLTLRDLLAQQPFHGGGGPNGTVRTFGPDTCQCWNGDTVLQDYSRALANSAPVSAHTITWHFYYTAGSIEPSVLNDPVTADRLVYRVTQAEGESTGTYLGGLPLVIGETGECADGGCTGFPNTTNAAAVGADDGNGGGPVVPFYSTTFLDGFLQMDKAGLAAALNISALMRQKAVGGNDGFIDPLSRPEANYWPMLAHKQLVGQTVLSVANSTADGRVVRVYAHCTRVWGAGGEDEEGGIGIGVGVIPTQLVPSYPAGSVTLLVINLSNDTAAQLQLSDWGSGAPIAAAPRDEYVFSGPMPDGMPGNDSNCFWDGWGPGKKPPYMPSPICLNKQLLYMTDGPAGPNTTLPSLVPVTVTDPSSPLVVQPVSFGFFVLPQSNVPACMAAAATKRAK